ncbi:biotin/lipoate A/B protein ligase family protein [Chloroflexota bacterium]
MIYTKKTWRLIKTPPAQGPWNMAVDEAVLEAVGKGVVPPTLRLYAWEPPYLSLGYAQPVADVSLEELNSQGWGIVRRPTGGRAILHTDELTYSVIGPHDDPHLAGGILESYSNLSQALLSALHMLGIPAEAQESNAGPGASRIKRREEKNKNPVCFEIPSNYEITVNGKKIVGSAQARRKEGVLQHGSLPLSGDLTRVVQVLKFPDNRAQADAARRLVNRAITAEEALGYPISWETAAGSFAIAFRDTLNLDLQLSDLTTGEQRRAEQLVQEKYTIPEWNNRI